MLMQDHNTYLADQLPGNNSRHFLTVGDWDVCKESPEMVMGWSTGASKEDSTGVITHRSSISRQLFHECEK